LVAGCGTGRGSVVEPWGEVWQSRRGGHLAVAIGQTKCEDFRSAALRSRARPEGNEWGTRCVGRHPGFAKKEKKKRGGGLSGVWERFYYDILTRNSLLQWKAKGYAKEKRGLSKQREIRIA